MDEAKEVKSQLSPLTRELLMSVMEKTVVRKGIPVEMPEWGRTVYVRPQTVHEADLDSIGIPKEEGLRLAAGVARILCDAEGTRLMINPTKEELQKFAQQPWTLLQRLIEKSMEFGHEKPDSKKPSGVSS